MTAALAMLAGLPLGKVYRLEGDFGAGGNKLSLISYWLDTRKEDGRGVCSGSAREWRRGDVFERGQVFRLTTDEIGRRWPDVCRVEVAL